MKISRAFYRAIRSILSTRYYPLDTIDSIPSAQYHRLDTIKGIPSTRYYPLNTIDSILEDAGYSSDGPHAMMSDKIIRKYNRWTPDCRVDCATLLLIKHLVDSD